MLVLYLYTLIIGHKSCNMLSILNILTLQKELQNLVTTTVCFFRQKSKTQQQQQNKETKQRTLAGVGK